MLACPELRFFALQREVVNHTTGSSCPRCLRRRLALTVAGTMRGLLASNQGALALCVCYDQPLRVPAAQKPGHMCVVEPS